MANTGYIINPYVQQVFTTGPNSGSTVSSSYIYTFDTSSSFTSSVFLGETFNYKELDIINCYISGVYVIPRFISSTVNNCSELPYKYNLRYNIQDTKINIPLIQVDYSLYSSFFTYNTQYISNSTDFENLSQITLSGSIIPLNKQQAVYFRLKNIYSGSFTSSYSGVLNAYCTQQTTVSNQNASSIGRCSTETMKITGTAFDEIRIQFSNINNGDSGYIFTIKNRTTNKTILSKNNVISISDLIILLPSNGILDLEFKMCANTGSGYVGMTFNIFDMEGNNIYNFYTQAIG